jgi:hypothetical protein
VVVPVTRRAGQPAQKALWGRQEPLSPPRRPAPTTKDRDLIEAVIQRAQDPGYVLIGPAERVFTRDPARKGVVEAVPKYEQDAVAQLLASGHLRIGGTHHVTYGDRNGPASAVLVPRATRQLADRWARLRPPADPITRTRP